MSISNISNISNISTYSLNYAIHQKPHQEIREEAHQEIKEKIKEIVQEISGAKKQGEENRVQELKSAFFDLSKKRLGDFLPGTCMSFINGAVGILIGNGYYSRAFW